jgi:uncharacterized protein (TIGR03435 family)
MKKLCLWIVALLAFSTSSLWAQDIAGTWQGTLLTPQKELRIVLKISKDEKGAWKTAMYSIDQGAWPMTASTSSLVGTTFKYTVSFIAGSYEGKVGTDGKTITGIWTQGPNPTPLNLLKVTAETAWAIPEPPPQPKAMAADANPSFDVATIKPSDPEKQGKGIRVNGRNFSTLNTTLADMIEFSYGVHLKQIVGAPDWLDKDKFDLAAVPDGEGQPNDKQWKGMLNKLLAERFKITFHHDKKDLSVYALTAGKAGPKLVKSESTNPLPGLFFRSAPGGIMLNVKNATMPDLTNLLQSAVLDRPVVDQSGLSGRFDFDLSWTPDDSQFNGHFHTPPQSTDAPLPGLFAAIQEQLGLKLDTTKTMVDVMVIDHAEKPSEN